MIVVVYNSYTKKPKGAVEFNAQEEVVGVFGPNPWRGNVTESWKRGEVRNMDEFVRFVIGNHGYNHYREVEELPPIEDFEVNA